MAKPSKRLSEDKERYQYKRVFSIDGIAIPHLYQRLGKYYAKITLPKGDKIVQTIIPLHVESLNEATAEVMKLTARCAVARARFKLKPKKPEDKSLS